MCGSYIKIGVGISSLLATASANNMKRNNNSESSLPAWRLLLSFTQWSMELDISEILILWKDAELCSDWPMRQSYILTQARVIIHTY